MSNSPRQHDGQPWYHEGLRFQCAGCGDCCTGEPGYVWTNKAEIEAMAAALNMKVARFEKRYVRRVGIRKSLRELAGGDCVLLDRESRTCRVYFTRPRQCRTWPFWASNLKTPATWRETCRCCPGADHGPLIPLDEIQAQVRVLRV